MRYLTLFLLTLLWHTWAIADSPDSSDRALQQLAAQLNAVTTLSGSFEQQRHIQALPHPLHSSGRFHFQREQGLKWVTQNPVQFSLAIDQSGVFLQREGETRSLSQSQYFSSLLMAIFSGNIAALQTQFDVTLTESEDGNWTIQLVPLSENLAAHLQHIQARGREHLQQLRIEEPNGDRTLIDLSPDTSASSPES